jgi:hypothetical protein
MSARSNKARQILRDRRAVARARKSIARRGEASLTRHAIAAGLPLREARSMATSLRDNAKKLGVTGNVVTLKASRGRRGNTSTRYTAVQVRQIAAAYRPRLAARKTAREYLLAA